MNKKKVEAKEWLPHRHLKNFIDDKYGYSKENLQFQRTLNLCYIEFLWKSHYNTTLSQVLWTS